ncbi:MAG TPA: AAA family ATPase [Candidatus Hydrogenedens sp.]|nr:AAA family ATPase [Candidatus Hydrogenedens sp.]
MEFIKGHIYGFGKLQKVSLEFGKGFQIVFVRDENGKNTLFQFLLDMLFGQKTSRKKNASFSENYYKYTPWHTSDYRGNIIYRFDTGKVIHLHRVFAPEAFLKIYEGLDVNDITDTFPVYPNGEPAFIKNHLDLSREIFTGLASISKKTIDDLNSFTHSNRIREHLLCLIDTGTTEQSINNIITTFQEYLQSIGTERTYKRPRNFISEQLKKLSEEYEQAKGNLEKIPQKRASLKEYKEQLNTVQREYKELQEKLQYARQYALWRRKNDAKALRDKLDELTARSFAYSSYKNFPLDQNIYVIQSEMAINHAEMQKQKLQNEIESISEEINNLELEIHHSSFIPIDYIKDYQDKYEEYLKHINSNEEVLKELYHQREKITEHIQEVEKIVSELPWVIQKDDMFYQKTDFAIDMYKSSLNETQKSEFQLNELKEEYARVQEQIQPFRELFAGITDFAGLVDEYLKYKDKPEEEQQELERQLQETEVIKQETLSQQPTNLLFGLFCLLLDIALLYMFIKMHKTESLWFAGAVGIGFLYFMSSYINSKRTLKNIDIFQQKLKEEIQKIVTFEYIDKHPITALLNKAHLQHTRELQGLYDEYCVWLKKEADLIQRIHKTEELFTINQSRTNDLFQEVQNLFEQVGLPLENTDKMEQNRRKVFELQEKVRMYHRRLWDLQEQYQQLTYTITKKEEYIKKIHHQIQEEIFNRIGHKLIQSGLLQSEEALSQDTFRSYYHAEEIYGGLKTKVSELRKKRLDMNQQLQKVEEEISQNQKQIKEILELAGVSSISEWKNKYTRAEEAHVIFSQMEQTKLQLQQLLNDETIEDLEKQTQDFVPSVPAEDEEQLQSLMNQKEQEAEQIQQDIQVLQSELEEWMKNSRPLNEIAEEKYYYETQWKTLQYEQESVLLAISVLQQLSTYRYHKIAQPLQNEMSRLLTHLTKGKYTGVLVDPDLTLKVIPAQTGKAIPLEELSSNPFLLEQLYFAMRVALMKIPHFLKEQLPLLLDNPFVSYDYPQWIQSLETLKALGEEQQIILFTYRKDIPDIANNLSIPISIIEDV